MLREPRISWHANVLEFMAEHNPSIKYLGLHFTPYTMPLPQTWDSDGAALWGFPDITVFGQAVYDAFLSPWRKLTHIPSLAYRRRITDFAFYINGTFNQVDRPLLRNDNYFEFLRVFRDTHGWMRETDHRVEVPATECGVPAPSFFDIWTLSRKTYLQEILNRTRPWRADITRRSLLCFSPSHAHSGREPAVRKRAR